MKKVFIDVETTGFGPSKSAIIELSGVVTDNDKIVETFEIKMKPHNGAMINDRALVVSGNSRQTIKSFQTSQEAYKEFISILYKYFVPSDDLENDKNKLTFCAHNVGFDKPFVETFMNKNSLEINYRNNSFSDFFNDNTICTMSLARKKLKTENYKLNEVANHLGIDFDNKSHHNALYDALISCSIYDKLKDM